MSDARKKVFQVLIWGLIPTTTVIAGTSNYRADIGFRSHRILYARNIFSTEEIDNHTSSKNKHAHLIIESAFRNAGYKGLVYLEIDNSTDCINMGTARVYRNGKDAAYVRTSQKTLDSLDDETIYAIAGHEAYHVKHKHQLVKSLGNIYLPLQIGALSYKMSRKLSQSLLSALFNENRWMRMLIRLPMFNIGVLGAATGMELISTLHKILEADADISSSINLGTANTLIRFFINHADHDKHDGVHPSVSNRIKYLSLVKNIIVSSNSNSFFKQAKADQSCAVVNPTPTKSENESTRKFH